MKAVVLERAHELSLREIDLPLKLGPRDVKIAVDTVGICGSDVHYYTHGGIGSVHLKSPMVLAHEAAGTVSRSACGGNGLGRAPGSGWSQAFRAWPRTRSRWASTTSIGA